MKRMLNFWNNDRKFIFLISVVSMIITHGFCFANLIYSHDSLFFYDISNIDKVALGRWLYPILVNLRKFATPWMLGTISIVYVSLAVVLVTKILEFDRIQGVCVSLIFTTSITLTSLFCTYIYDADADCLAILLAVFSVYAFKYFPKHINVVVASIALTLCLALYQAYICVAIGLFVFLIIYKSKDIKNWKEVLNVFCVGVRELATILIGTILYVICMNIVSNRLGINLSSKYNGAGKLSSLTIGMVLENIPKSYVYFKDYFFKVTGYNTNVMKNVYWIILILSIVSIIIYIVNSRPFWGSLLLTIPCVLILPLALNAIYLVSFGLMHQLMIFAFGIALLVPFVFLNITNNNRINEYIKKSIRVILVCLISFVSIENVIYANGAYTYKKLVYDNTALHAQTIWKDINSIDGYVEGETQVVFMGDFQKSKVAYISSVGEKYNGVLTGSSTSAITYDITVNNYFYAILGRDMSIANDDANIQENEQYINMPVYPSSGYCKMIDGIVYVKISN